MAPSFDIPSFPTIGCAVVVAIALVSGFFQAWLFVRFPRNRFHGWGALLSFATAAFSAASFVGYGHYDDRIVVFSEKIQFCTFPVIAHSLYGFSFNFLKRNFRFLNRVLTAADVVLIALVLSTDLVVSHTILDKHFSDIVPSYLEPATGPLGTYFIVVFFLLSICSLLVWFLTPSMGNVRKTPYLVGFVLWAVTAAHDSLMTFGMPGYLYLMSYGVLGFNIAVVWTTTEDYMNLKEALEIRNVNLESLVAQRTADLKQINRELEKEIGERRVAEKALQESEERFRGIFETSPIGIAIVDTENLKFLDANESYQRLLGYDVGELRGLSLKEITHPDDWAGGITSILSPLMLQGSDGGPEKRYLCRDGSIRWVHVTGDVFRIDSHYRPLAVVNVEDITERKRSEQVRNKLESQLRQSQKMEAIGTLAGGIAHDFNNILGAIMGYTELALMENREGRTSPADLEEVFKAAVRARDLVQQILSFSRKGDVHFKPLSLNNEVKQASRILERAIPKMIDIRLRLQEGLHLIQGDVGQMEEVLLNLGSNAKDAMPDGGTLVFQTENVTLDETFCRQNPDTFPGDYVKLSVSDSGFGIDKETLVQIFDPFFTTKEVGSGTGMGLAIVYGIVKNHGGHIRCSSEPGRGTCFEIYLPAIKGEVQPIRNNKTVDYEPKRGRETVLVVDDEAPLRDIAARILGDSGYRVLQADSGENALRLVRESSGDVDLVILDLNMPGIGGYRCLQQLVKLKPNIKVIVSSGYSKSSSAEDVLYEGAVAYVSKPFTNAGLLKIVRGVLDNQP